MPTRQIKPPPLWMTALESRVVSEYASWAVTRPAMQCLPNGDGHPVLVLPGFTAADRSTARLRELLRSLGYRTYGWGLGANLGPTPRIVDGIRRRVDRITAARGEPISVIGWSLGGIFARVMAREQPDRFRQVITMGSPFRMTPDDRSAASGMWDRLRPLHDDEILEGLDVRDRGELPVPTTAIYSRTDGVVWWRACLETVGPQAENVEVYGSHCGLGFNPSVAYVIADRLAQPADDWQPFEAPLWAKAAYPTPVDYRTID